MKPIYVPVEIQALCFKNCRKVAYAQDYDTHIVDQYIVLKLMISTYRILSRQFVLTNKFTISCHGYNYSRDYKIRNWARDNQFEFSIFGHFVQKGLRLGYHVKIFFGPNIKNYKQKIYAVFTRDK